MKRVHDLFAKRLYYSAYETGFTRECQTLFFFNRFNLFIRFISLSSTKKDDQCFVLKSKT